MTLLFLAVYMTCNAIADRATGHPTLFAEWERHIPFVPAAILPYWSIDLFFFAAPLFCPTAPVLRRHAARTAAATLVAGAFFLAFPLTFAWERPAVGGVLGALFRLLDGVDRPHNLFPSLHVAYATILWPVYGSLGRPGRITVRAWLVLSVVATLFTFQHHVADVAGGFALGFGCLVLWPAHPISRPLQELPP
ncbi:MAG: hypothetical protein HYY18_08185 [Planctomycetes bacterium]|nr:hypothetical protein [Planctomycetota bacterium]